MNDNLKEAARQFVASIEQDLRDQSDRLKLEWEKVRPDVEEFAALSAETALAKAAGEETERAEAGLSSLMASLKGRNAAVLAVEARRLLSERFALGLTTLLRAVL